MTKKITYPGPVTKALNVLYKTGFRTKRSVVAGIKSKKITGKRGQIPGFSKLSFKNVCKAFNIHFIENPVHQVRKPSNTQRELS